MLIKNMKICTAFPPHLNYKPMRIKRIFYSVTCALLFLASPFIANAQEAMSLQECIKHALNHNLDYQQTKLEKEQKALDLKKQRFNQLPSLDANIAPGLNYGRTVDPYSNQFVQQNLRSMSVSLNTNWILFNGFETQNQIKSKRQALKASQHNQEKVEDDISLQVTQYYMQILMNREKLDAAISQKNNTASLVEQTEILVESGKVNKTELLELKAQLSTEESQVIQARNDLELARLKLQQYINWERENKLRIQNMEVPDTLQQSKEGNLPRVVRNNYERLPEVKQAKANLEQANYSLKAAKSGRSPSLNLSANLNSGYSSRTKEVTGISSRSLDTIGATTDGVPVIAPNTTPELKTMAFDKQIENNFGQIINLSLNIPIFTNYSIQHGIQTAKVQSSIAQIQLKKAKDQIKNNIHQAYAEANNAYSNYKASMEQYQAQKALFEQNDLRFNEGHINYYDWKSSKNSMTSANNDFINAKYNYLLQKKLYEFYLGKDLNLEELKE